MGHVDLDREVFVVDQVLLHVLMRIVYHCLVDIEHSAAVDEESVEPEVKGRFFATVELYAHVIIDKQVLAPNVEVEI